MKKGDSLWKLISLLVPWKFIDEKVQKVDNI